MMKRCLLIFSAWVIGVTGVLTFTSTKALAANGGAAFAREHGQDRDDQDREEHRDRGRHRGWRHDRFDNDDRREAHEWYEHHREYQDRDRFAPEYEEQLRSGYVLGPELRERCRPVPEDLAYRLGPPPRNCRFVLIGGHICLIDRGYRVRDVIHLELNL